MNAAYEEYLHSAQWREVSARRKALDCYKCQCCGATENIAAHHVKYPANWYDTECEHLITLCKNCHTIVHRLQEEDAKWDRARTAQGEKLTREAYQKCQVELARIYTVECWRRNIFSQSDVSKFCRALAEAVNKSQRDIHAPVEYIMKFLATAKDCLVANGEPTFDRSKQKHRKLGKTKYK